jgi:hypothetical protein
VGHFFSYRTPGFSRVRVTEAELGQQFLDAAKRKTLEIILSNCKLVDATLHHTIKKPFEVIAKRLISKESGGNRTPMELSLDGLRGWSIGSPAGLYAMEARIGVAD